MSPIGILLLQALTVGGLIVLTSELCGVDRTRVSRPELRRRIRDVAPYAALLAVFYALNTASQTVGAELSAAVASDVTADLHAIEGDFVASVQALGPDWVAGYFSFVYLFGFVYLLAFPVVAYLFHPDRRHVGELLAAYALAYGGGVVCYVLVVARGPRNVIGSVGAPMYQLYPETAEVTGVVNSAANVFPSLHAAFAVVVAITAWRSRSTYPRWTWIASALAVNVLVATMYLGIHWLVDVVAGVGLAGISCAVAFHLVDRTTDVRAGSPVGR